MNALKQLLIISLFGTSLSLAACGQSNQEEETNESYQDTIEAPTTDDNNMRNDQPTDELTQKDSLKKDSI